MKPTETDLTKDDDKNDNENDENVPEDVQDDYDNHDDVVTWTPVWTVTDPVTSRYSFLREVRCLSTLHRGDVTRSLDSTFYSSFGSLFHTVLDRRIFPSTQWSLT